MIETIGFIGLGLMGKPMAINLMKAGYRLTVHNRSRAVVDELAADGAIPANSPQEASEKADLVITMLPADSHVTEVILGGDGVIQSIRPGAVVADMSTISPTTVKQISKRLSEKEVYMLDAPVSGGDVAAIDASLSIMVGGEPEIFERALPVFQKLGRNINHIGENGAGQVTKAANQIIVALTIEAVAEAFIFAKKSGVDPAKVRKAIMGGYAQSRILELHGKRMIDRNFTPGGKARSHQKDIDIVLSVAKDLDICLPVTAYSAQLWNALAARGELDLDHSAIVRVLETMSGTKVCSD